MKSPNHLTIKRPGKGREAALALLVLTLPFFLGAWKISMGRAINPSYVERIKDGQTKKHEVLTLFGDPDKVDRTPEGLVYIYQSFRNKETLPKRGREVKSTIQDSPYFREDWLEKKAERESSSNQELDRELVIRFDQQGETVQSHQYKQF